MSNGFASIRGHVPDVISSGPRTHCERCGAALAADRAHYCDANSHCQRCGGALTPGAPHYCEQETYDFVCAIPTCSVSIEHTHQPLPKFTCDTCHQTYALDAGHDREACARSNAKAITPAEQAELDRARDIVSVTYIPPVAIQGEIQLTEQQKYELMWAEPAYRAVAPGEALASLFLAQPAGPKPGAEVIDFGAGTGRGALMLALLGQCRVHMVDFAANSLDDDLRAMLATQAQSLDFLQHDLNAPLPFTAEYGFCTDVLEHIPPGEVDAVLKNILGAARHVFFQISCGDDVCGQLIHERLHLSVHDYDWWRAKFLAFEAKIHWSENRGGSALFYLTAWSDGEDFQKAGVLNIEEDQIRANVRANCLGGWQQMSPHRANDSELVVLCGGPSLDSQLATIKELRAAGAGTVTMNGAYHWAIENAVYPGCQIVCDGRPHNRRFVEPVIEGCKYLIASQCDPAVFAGLPADRTFMWHTTAEAIRDILTELLPQWWGVPGGCTVLLRALPMLRMLGFQKFHLFGADSCLMDGKHHAYSQPENDGQLVVPTIVGGRTFQCHPWQIAQAQEWQHLIQILGETFQVEVYGDGLLAWIMQHAADLDVEEEAKNAAAGV